MMDERYTRLQSHLWKRLECASYKTSFLTKAYKFMVQAYCLHVIWDIGMCWSFFSFSILYVYMLHAQWPSIPLLLGYYAIKHDKLFLWQRFIRETHMNTCTSFWFHVWRLQRSATLLNWCKSVNKFLSYRPKCDTGMIRMIHMIRIPFILTNSDFSTSCPGY